MEKGTIRQGQLEAERIARLKSGLDDSMKARLEKMVKTEVNISRAKVIEAYKHILSNEGNASAGKEVFRKQCSTCHKLEGVGYQVGPELIAAIRGKGKEYLLTSILDPSKEVDSRYVNYTVETKQGRVLSGILVAESGTSVTLRRGENAEDTLLRNQIESIQSANKSLMPEGLEAQINQKDMSDLLEYLVKIANN
jgi:putative heme-binding domain-containing protein